MQAAVIGGGMAGLMAAHVLAEAYERVVVFDRDSLGPEAAPRRGVPQGNHLHLLLTTGYRALRALFPGFEDDLRAAGVQPFDIGRQLRYRRRGALKRSFDSELQTVAVSRPTLEALVQRRVTAASNVELRGGSAVAGLHAEGSRVCAVQLEGGERHPADLVVDAGGRGSRIMRWLPQLGWPTPRATQIELGLAYASRVVRLAPDPDRRWTMLYVGPAADTWTRGGAIMQVEGERAIVTLAGYGGDHAPLDDEGFLAFTTGFDPEFHTTLRDAEPLTRIHRFNIPVMRRYHFELLREHPPGLLALGDTLCLLDPAYGQGMSVAAEQVRALRTLLQEGTPPPALPRRFYPAAKAIIDRAWIPTLIENFRRPDTRGPRPPGLGLLQWYVGHVMDLADRHPPVHRALEESLHMTTGPLGLLRPQVLGRVLARAAGLGA